MTYQKRVNCIVPLCFGQAERLGMCQYHYGLAFEEFKDAIREIDKIK